MLYVKPKSFLKVLINKIFLKFLLKFFPKKFLSYKNKIKTIMNKGAFYLFLTLKTIYLKFKYPLYISLPPRNIYALHTLFKFSEVLKQQKIDFFLTSGSLLGAVRQESFAGRPKDIDLGIKEDQFLKLFNAIPLLIKSGVIAVRKVPYNKSNNKVVRLHIVYPYSLVDIAIYRKKKVGKEEMWIGETNRNFDMKFNGIALPVANLEHLVPIQLYGKKFLAPTNPEIYLEKVFGKNWRIPDKKQFFWNKNKMKSLIDLQKRS